MIFWHYAINFLIYHPSFSNIERTLFGKRYRNKSHKLPIGCRMRGDETV